MSDDILPGGVGLRRWGSASDPPNAQQLGVLRRTVALLPIEHLVLLRTVEARRPGQPPRRGGGNQPGNRIVLLSAASFGRTYNQQVNITFLHEMGHVVDYHHQCTREIQQMARRGDRDAQALLATPHEGTTQFAGEKIADCYMVLFRSLAVQRPYSHPASPSSYRGAEAERRFAVLLRTSAFTRFRLTRQRLVPANFDELLTSLVEGR